MHKVLALLFVCVALFATITHQQSTSDESSHHTDIYSTSDAHSTHDAETTHQTDAHSTHDAETTDDHSTIEPTHETTHEKSEPMTSTEHQTSAHHETTDKESTPHAPSTDAQTHEPTEELTGSPSEQHHTTDESKHSEASTSVGTETQETTEITHKSEEPTTDLPSTEHSDHSTDSVGTDGSTVSDGRLNYCPQVFPECSCYTSPVVMKCDNFAQFSKLDFKKLISETNQEYSVYELEISPKTPIMLSSDLDLTGLNKSYLSQVILRNINGFDYFANPFEDFKAVNGDLRLFIYDSTIQFFLTGSPVKAESRVPVTTVHCDLRLVEDKEDYHPIFSSFNFISFSASLEYPDKLCPLAFRNSHLRLVQFYGFNESSPLAFDVLNKNAKAITSLSSSITNVNIFETTGLVLTSSFLNADVFELLYQLNVESCTMKRIEVDTFKHINSLRRVILFLENFGEFIRSTPDNPWMANLNGNVRVNLDNATEVAANKDKQMIITFNDRSNGQKYEWPDRDITYFVNFPHDKLVFPRILANVDITKCSLSLSWLYLYRNLANNQADLNTTSSYSCLLNEPITTTAAITSPSTTPTIAPATTQNKYKFTNTQFYVTLGVLLGAVAVLFVAVIMLCVKNNKLKASFRQVDDEVSMRRF